MNPKNKTLAFKVSSGLKNLIGRDLISDKYIAIFELVKIHMMRMQATLRFLI